LIYLKSLKIREGGNPDAYPFNVPVIKSMTSMEFESPVTLFVGENGSGKSTVIEAMAAAIGLPTIGYDNADTDKTLGHVRKLSQCLSMYWTINPHRGFFLRSEDFFNFTRRLSELKSEMLLRLAEIDEEYRDRSAYARSLARMPYLRSLAETRERYGEDLDANSHGESFLKVFQSRFVPGGIYLMDEPEVPLSPIRQLSLISLVSDMVKQKCQFVIATHSPILMAIPGAVIYNFDEHPPKRVDYNELEHVKLTRDFLNNPERFLRHLI